LQPDVLITQAEFARLAGVSRSAVKQAINNGLIAAVVEQGGRTLINKNEGLRQYHANSRRQRKPKALPPVPATLGDETGLGMLSWGRSESQPETQEPEPEQHRVQSTIKAPANSGGLPEYAKSRARSEFEKANLLELDRKTKEGQLLNREDVEQAWNAAVNITRTKVLGVPSRAKQQIPHLTPDEVEVVRDLLREALEELAAGEVTA